MKSKEAAIGRYDIARPQTIILKYPPGHIFSQFLSCRRLRYEVPAFAPDGFRLFTGGFDLSLPLLPADLRRILFKGLLRKTSDWQQSKSTKRDRADEPRHPSMIAVHQTKRRSRKPRRWTAAAQPFAEAAN